MEVNGTGLARIPAQLSSAGAKRDPKVKTSDKRLRTSHNFLRNKIKTSSLKDNNDLKDLLAS